MKKKLFLLTLIISALLCLFAISVSATEYTVKTADEFNSAFAEAVDGDTIVIKADISAQFNFGKTITYILDGGVKWSATGGYGTNMCDATGKDVKVYARNGNGTFYPAASMWFNNTGDNKTSDLSSTTFSLGSLDNSKLILDCSVFTANNSRMFYSATLKEFNLLPGASVTNLNVVNSGSCYIYATTVNMYEGAEIYGNKMTNYTAIIRANTFNMYGGKVYGNYFGCYGLSQSDNNVVFGGEIFDNYVTGAANSSVPSALLNNKAGSGNGKFIIYGGSINNNILLTSNAERQAILCAAGGSYITSGVYFDNYETTDWGEAPTKVGNVYTSAYDVANASESTIQGNYSTAVYSLIFKNADSSVINAYMVKADGTVLKAVDSSTEITVPSDVSKWTTKMNYCVGVTPDIAKQGTYYVAVDHKTEDDHNCQTALICKTCEVVIIEALEHIIDEIYEYQNGYLEKGIHKIGCTREGCEYGSTETLSPLFVNKGYTRSNDGSSFAYGISIDKDAIMLYEDATGITINYGIIVGQPNGDNGNIVDMDGKSLLDKSVIASFVDVKYNIYNVKLTDISTEEQRNMDIYCCAYVVDGTKVRYIGKSETGSAVAINLNKIPVIDE